MIQKNKKIILWDPKMLWGLLQYKLCLISREKIESQMNSFMQAVINDENSIRKMTAQFWEKHENRLNLELIKQIEVQDIIISASPSFLIEGIKNRLGTSNLLCSDFDLTNKCIRYLNYGENKVKTYCEKFGTQPIEVFYTDSYNDKPIMDISQKVYLVKNTKIRQLK